MANYYFAKLIVYTILIHGKARFKLYILVLGSMADHDQLFHCKKVLILGKT